MVRWIRSCILSAGAWYITVLSPPSAVCQQAPANRQAPNANPSEADAPELGELGVFRKPPRELQRYLDRAHRAKRPHPGDLRGDGVGADARSASHAFNRTR